MKNNNQKTVVLGLSGGVDSSIAALLLKKQNYKVIGAFMKNFSDTKNPLTGECSWREEKRMAERIAIKLGIPFVVFDFEKEYKNQVIKPMYKEYKQGLTPNPDIACNTIIKFPLFWRRAQKLGADYIAFGHYARTKKDKLGFHLLAGKDKTKDQSYFLAGLSQKDLQHTLFPIGNLTKQEVRKIAKNNNFPNYDKRSTRGICFVGKVDMKSFLEKNIKNKPGLVKDEKGNTIGTHPGSFYFTIGQRLGEHLGVKINKPKGDEQKKYYLAYKKGNTIVAVPEGSPLLSKKQVKLKHLHFINNKTKIPGDLKARIRHLGEFHPGILKRNIFTFNKPVSSIAPGQYLVIYHNDELIASGEIQ